MKITLTGKKPGGTANETYVLCAGDMRNEDGDPIGPDQLNAHLAPGILEREYLNAPGITAEARGCDRKALTFRVHRIYKTVELALQGLADGFDLPREGEIKFGDKTFMTQAATKPVTFDLEGCRLTINYEFIGW